MSLKSKLLKAGLGSLAIGVPNPGHAATDSAVKPVYRLHELRAEYLKSIGKPESAEERAAVHLAQWNNFPNFSNWNNWFNGWKNF